MNHVRKHLTMAAIAGACLLGAGAASAQYSNANPYGPGGFYWNYHESIDKMPAEDKAKLMAMTDKMMQSEMDFKMQMAKMQEQHAVDVAKMQRDIDVWLMNYRTGGH